jgi:hypothetical protein
MTIAIALACASLGACVGYFVCAAFVVAKKEDAAIEEWRRNGRTYALDKEDVA